MGFSNQFYKSDVLDFENKINSFIINITFNIFDTRTFTIICYYIYRILKRKEIQRFYMHLLLPIICRSRRNICVCFSKNLRNDVLIALLLGMLIANGPDQSLSTP